MVNLVLQAIAGLEHIHSLGILSRDVKPQNMLITNREGVSNANVPLHFPEYTEIVYGTNERSAAFFAHKRQAETS